jgi:hypothetical protein
VVVRLEILVGQEQVVIMLMVAQVGKILVEVLEVVVTIWHQVIMVAQVS